MCDNEGALQIENDDLGKKTKPILTRSGATFGVLRFHERPFSNTLLKFPACWDFKPTSAIHAYSPGVYTSDKSINLSTIDKIHVNVMLLMAVSQMEYESLFFLVLY